MSERSGTERAIARKRSLDKVSRLFREMLRQDWARTHLRVGDWVKVSGTKSDIKTRLVLELTMDGFIGAFGDPVTGTVHDKESHMSYWNITHVWNPVTSTLEKVI